MKRPERIEAERHFLVKVTLSLVFGGLGMVFIQKPLIIFLSTHIPDLPAYALAYILSGQVVFMLDFFIARYKRGLTRAHFRQIDWKEFRRSWYLHNGMSVIGSGINAFTLYLYHPSDHKIVNVIIANTASALFTQTVKWLYIHGPLRVTIQFHKSRREE